MYTGVFHTHIDTLFLRVLARCPPCSGSIKNGVSRQHIASRKSIKFMSTPPRCRHHAEKCCKRNNLHCAGPQCGEMGMNKVTCTPFFNISQPAHNSFGLALALRRKGNYLLRDMRRSLPRRRRSGTRLLAIWQRRDSRAAFAFMVRVFQQLAVCVFASCFCWSACEHHSATLYLSQFQLHRQIKIMRVYTCGRQ
jgi:hypothetical protein